MLFNIQAKAVDEQLGLFKEHKGYYLDIAFVSAFYMGIKEIYMLGFVEYEDVVGRVGERR